MLCSRASGNDGDRRLRRKRNNNQRRTHSANLSWESSSLLLLLVVQLFLVLNYDHYSIVSVVPVVHGFSSSSSNKNTNDVGNAIKNAEAKEPAKKGGNFFQELFSSLPSSSSTPKQQQPPKRGTTPGPFRPPSLVMTPEAKFFLDGLQLQSDTTPEKFKTTPGNLPNLLTASLPIVLRAGGGLFGLDYKLSLSDLDETQYSFARFPSLKKQLSESNSPAITTENRFSAKQPLILYEYEPSPFCRKVREACCLLSLVVTIRPAPRGGRIFRPEIKEKYGSKTTFPLLMDPNTSVTLMESSDIVKYVMTNYGGRSNDQPVPWSVQDSLWTTFSCALGAVFRGLAGGKYQPSDTTKVVQPNQPMQPLIFWGYEGSPFCKIVREALSSYELEHTIVFTPRGSPNRQVLFELTKELDSTEQPFFQVPLLQDPNTGVNLFESSAILEYLDKVYGIEQTPVQFL